MVAAHGNYAAWAAWLEAYGRGTDLPSRHLTAIDDGLGPHMQERLLLRIKAAFEERTRLWSETLRRHLESGAVREVRELGAALVAARGRLQPLRLLTTDPRLPEPVRSGMRDALAEMLRSSQDSLENSVRRQPRDSERLLAVVRENTLTAALDPPVLPPARTGSALPPPAGRQVIIL